MSEWLVACLCAEWCGSCREYRPPFESVAREMADAARFAWIDIEDEPQVPGDLEIVSFPSLLIARDDEIYFYGAITPQPATLSRLVRRALAGELGVVRDAALAGLAARARAAIG